MTSPFSFKCLLVIHLGVFLINQFLHIFSEGLVWVWWVHEWLFLGLQRLQLGNHCSVLIPGRHHWSPVPFISTQTSVSFVLWLSHRTRKYRRYFVVIGCYYGSTRSNTVLCNHSQSGSVTHTHMLKHTNTRAKTLSLTSLNKIDFLKKTFEQKL